MIIQRNTLVQKTGQNWEENQKILHISSLKYFVHRYVYLEDKLNKIELNFDFARLKHYVIVKCFVINIIN